MWKKVNSPDELKVGDRVRYFGLSGEYGTDSKRIVKSINPFHVCENGEESGAGTKEFYLWHTFEVFVPENPFNARELGIASGLALLQEFAHCAAKDTGWWNDLETGAALPLTQERVGDKLMLVVTEIAEAKEGYRKGLMDDHLPHRKMIEVELADAVIRIADLAGALGLDLGAAIVEKMRYNAQREDHKIENRIKEGGKKT
jgi:NTP pyrophosphatase (non-canonical NTP hydrolase)